MRRRILLLTIPTALLFVLVLGSSVTQAQFQDLDVPDPFWNDRLELGLPRGGDDEGDDECDDRPAPVPKTGQTLPYWTRDDGELQTGIAWPDPRFTDNVDGTVTDLLTGLVWLKDATLLSASAWNPALAACNDLADDGVNLSDGSMAGDWRLPNNKELRSLIDFGNTNPALPTGHPFIVPDGGTLWTSTTATNNFGRAWVIEDATMVNDPKNTPNWVWPVRDGDAVDLSPAAVAKTGQTIPYGTRDDGELQKGVEWPDPRFTDNLDGTVTDELTGLIWLANAARISPMPFEDALGACSDLADDGLTLTDDSVVGDWRLPNIWELGSLNDFSQIGPALPDGHPFTGANPGTFWSSTTWEGNGNRAWGMGLGIGKISHLPKGSSNAVWAVRGCDCDDEGDDEGDDDEDGDANGGAGFGSQASPDTAASGGGIQNFGANDSASQHAYGMTGQGTLDRQEVKRSLDARPRPRSASERRGR